MSIGYCTKTDPFDKRSWSGTHYYILKTLENHVCPVDALGPITHPLFFLGRALGKVSLITLKKRFLYSHSTYFSKKYAEILKRKLASKEFQFLFFPAESDLLAYIDSSLPVVYLSDATFKAMISYHPGFTNLHGFNERSGDEIERRAIERADLILYSSEWAKKSAIRDYQCTPDKIHVLPFGANIDFVPLRETLMSVREEDKRILKLLFIGVNWYRKGGDIAFRTLLELNKRGIETELTICGCNPPGDIVHPSLRIVRFLNKNREDDVQELSRLYQESTLFILPTRNECAGIVFSEASAFALPIVATDTGGVNTYVRNGINGFTLPIDAGPEEYASIIKRIWEGKSLYLSLCIGARDLYDKELNWERWGEEVKKLTAKFLNNKT